MDTPTQPKKQWVLTQEAFDLFLARLDPDRDKAGEKYEIIRLKLVRYFQWRGSDTSEMESDETINRVARRLWEGENIYNLNAYIYGVARIVWEEARKRRNLLVELDEAADIVVLVEDDDFEKAELQKCLDRCLGYLADEDRETITEYYQFEKGKKIENRKKLAERFGITLNALRIKAHRKRNNLEACVRECMSPPGS